MSVPFPMDEDIEYAASLLARLFVLLDPHLDEHICYGVLRDAIYGGGLEIETAHDIVNQIKKAHGKDLQYTH